MSEITKMLGAVGLLAAGFFSASLLGTPEASDTSNPATGEWAPERLEPLDPAALVPSQAAATWDQQVAPATHAAGDGFATHQAARPEWPAPPVAASAGATTTIPEIRSGVSPPPAALGSGGSSNWWDRAAPAGEPLATLEPPPLLAGGTTTTALRPSRFPDRPADATGGMMANSAPLSPPGLPMNDRGASGQSFEPPSLAAQDAWNAAGPSLNRQSFESQPMAPAMNSSEPIWHVVSDGDSLAKIAQRYLSDANRAREIYDLNRDVLTSPDLLPIGAELRIPQTASPRRTFEVFDASGSQANAYQQQSRLVPLPELPDSVRQMPRARLQGPVNASMAVAP